MLASVSTRDDHLLWAIPVDLLVLDSLVFHSCLCDIQKGIYRMV